MTMSLLKHIGERMFGKTHYSSGDIVKYELLAGTVKHHIEVRVQGDDGIVYFRASAGDGWMPLEPVMARTFAKCLMDAAEVAEEKV